MWWFPFGNLLLISQVSTQLSTISWTRTIIHISVKLFLLCRVYLRHSLRNVARPFSTRKCWWRVITQHTKAKNSTVERWRVMLFHHGIFIIELLLYLSTLCCASFFMLLYVYETWWNSRELYDDSKELAWVHWLRVEVCWWWNWMRLY